MIDGDELSKTSRDIARRITLMSFDANPYLTAEEVAIHLRVSYATVGRWVKLGLPTHQATTRGRRLFDLVEVDSWLKSRWSAPNPDQGTAA